MAAAVETFVRKNADGHDVLYAQRIDGAAHPIGDPIQVTPDNVDASAKSTLLLSNGGFLIAYEYSTPGSESDDYPVEYVATRQFGPSNELVAERLIGRNSVEEFTEIESIALDKGAYASLVHSVHYAIGATFDFHSLNFVDAFGTVAETGLPANSYGFDPSPKIVYGDFNLTKSGNGNFAISWNGRYGDGVPDISPDEPAPEDSQQFKQVYRADGTLLSKTFIDFGHATDLYSTTVSAKLADNLFNLTLLGNDRISGIGNAHDNILTGNDAKNHLVGLAGDDRLDGGLGTDYLEGGAGHDTFVFSTKIMGIFNSDLVADFTHGEDKIELSSKIFTGLASGQLAAADFADLGAGTANPDSHIRYDATGNLSFDPDGSGNGPAYQFATLAGHPTLTASDIIVV